MAADPLLLDRPIFEPEHFSDDPSNTVFFDPSAPAYDFDLPDIHLDDYDFNLDDLLQIPPDDLDSSHLGSASNSSSAGGGGDPPSPDSGHSGVTGEEAKPGEERLDWGLKRKKDDDDDEKPVVQPSPNPSSNPRSSKYRRSLEEANATSCLFSAGSDDDDKRRARLMRNRESAQLSRQRKKHYVEELEEKVKAMHSTINELNTKISYVMAENVSLRQRFGGGNGVACPPPPPGAVYPQMGPMHFPWIPCSAYALRHQGSQVPLVPIPKLKPQQPAPAPKAKKSDSKTKKVASICLLGLFLIFMVIGGALSGFNFIQGEVSNVGGVKVGILGKSLGSYSGVRGYANVLNGTVDIELCGKMDVGKGGIEPGMGKKCQTHNSSNPLPALLYVPRNGRHVKIDGNLIIHSVLASEKAMEHASSYKQQGTKDRKETGLAIAQNVGSTLAVSKGGNEGERHSNLYRKLPEQPRALGSDSQDAYGDSSNSTPADGPLQQWFSEGLTGPLLNSGMCTEVFQFDASPTSSGIVPANSIVNATSDRLPSQSTKNRRILYPNSIPLAGATINSTNDFSEHSESSDIHGNKSSSSIVVSVLFDPRDAGDGDVDGMVSPKKSLTRIFVVVLLDSVKYVTYSCVLPFKNSSPHLVN